MTRVQRAVWEALGDVATFVSAQDLHARLRGSAHPVGLTSVYRALQALADTGQVDVRRTPSGEAAYRRCDTSRHHHHLVCGRCGDAVEVEAPALERWVADVAARHGYAVDSHTLEITGTCRRCAKTSATVVKSGS